MFVKHYLGYVRWSKPEKPVQRSTFEGFACNAEYITLTRAEPKITQDLSDHLPGKTNKILVMTLLHVNSSWPRAFLPFTAVHVRCLDRPFSPGESGAPCAARHSVRSLVHFQSPSGSTPHDLRNRLS
jgi:hypothetical protein